MSSIQITDLLRRRVLADLHLGRLKPGDRLPSLRMVAREMGVSVRAVARAYSALEREGLVSVKGRSGIYLVLPQTIDIALEEPLAWYADMLKDAWSRRLTVSDVNLMLQDLVANPTYVACVESTDDHMEAFCGEVEDDFALRSVSVMLVPEGARVGDEIMTLYDALSNVDFVITTAFHAAEVRAAADLLHIPVVIVSVNDLLVETLEKQLQLGPVTIVAADPLFVERFHQYLLERFRESGEMRVVSIDDALNNPSILEGTTTLYTRAARHRLNETEYHLLPPPIPFLSSTAARKVVQCMLNAHAKRVLQLA